MLNRFNPFGRGRTLGLDLGSHSLKWALVDTGRGLVEQSGALALFPDRTGPHQPPPHEQVNACLAQAVKGLPASVKSVRTAVQGRGTAYGYLEFPRLEPDELEVAAQAEAQRFIPFPPEQARFTFTPVAPLDGGDRSAVFYVAARNDEVVRLRGLLAEQGLEVTRMEVPAVALAREFQRNHSPPLDSFVGLVHVGFSLTQVVVVRGGFPYYARDFAPAGRDMIFALEMARHCGWEQAEKELGLLDLTVPGNPAEPPVSKLADGVKRTLASFGQELSAVYLSGGGGVASMERRLARELGREVFRDDWKELTCHQGPSPELLKVAVGLAVA